MADIAQSCRKVEYIRLRHPPPDFINSVIAVKSLKELDVIEMRRMKLREERGNKTKKNFRLESVELLYKWKRG